MNGIIPLYKPKGFTSHDCVAKVRRLIHMKKVGHTGTLDPNVEGVLPICVGEATKIIPFVLDLKKEYIAEVYLGKATSTEDADGEVTEECAVQSYPTFDEIDHVLQGFVGEINQIPPMYSAIKINGKKLYEYARQGMEIERPARKVTIFDLELIRDTPNKADTFQFRVLCSKGTYIRTLCVEIGKQLGYPAHMSHLLRTNSDGIAIENTLTFTELNEKIEAKAFLDMLLPVAYGVSHLAGIQLDKVWKQKVLQGQKLPLPERLPNTEQFKMMYEDELLAIYEVHPTDKQTIKPVRVFNMYKSEGE